MEGYLVYNLGSKNSIKKKTIRVFNDVLKAGKYYIKITSKIFGGFGFDSWSCSIRSINFETGKVSKPLKGNQIREMFESEPELVKEITKVMLK